jgi:hypothetical protein
MERQINRPRTSVPDTSWNGGCAPRREKICRQRWTNGWPDFASKPEDSVAFGEPDMAPTNKNPNVP